MIDGCVFLRDDIGGNGPVCAYPWEKMLSECTYEEGYKTCPHLEFSLKKIRELSEWKPFMQVGNDQSYGKTIIYTCGNCGRKNGERTNFCQSCGRKMELEHETD